MKKFLYGVAFVLYPCFSTYAADISAYENDFKRQTKALQGKRSLLTREQLAKGAKYGAAAGAAVLGAAAAFDSGSKPKEDFILAEAAKQKRYSEGVQSAAKISEGVARGAIAGALLGGMWSIPIATGLQWWQRRIINRAVHKHLNVDFKSMPIVPAMLVVAAYKRNVPMMKTIINRQLEFVNQKEVWALLTELFFNKKPTNTRVKKLQKIIKDYKA